MFGGKDKKAARSDAAATGPAVALPPRPASESVVLPSTPVTSPAPVAAVQERPMNQSPTNTISKGTTLQGNIETDANLRIEGRMKGDVKARSTFFVGEGAVVEGNISAEMAEIAGEIRGQIEVANTLLLKPTAIVHGDIITAKLVVEAGAQFNGSCKMGAQATPLKMPAAETRTAAPMRRADVVAATN